MQSASKTAIKTALVLFLLLLVISILKSPYAASLWLDELLSDWISADGVGAAWRRALEFQASSPAYFLFLALWKTIAGSSEVILRLPSLVCFLVSCYFLFNLARKLFDLEVAVVSLICLLAIDPVMSAAISARPYAAALMFGLVSFDALVEWDKTGKAGSAHRWLWASVLMFYCHYLSLTVFLVQAFYIYRTRPDGPARKGYNHALRLFLLLLPGLYHMLLIKGRSALYGSDFVFEPLKFIGIIFPPYLAIALVFAILCGAIAERSWFGLPENRKAVRCIIVWAMLPALMLFLISLVSGRSILLDRYALWGYPGLAILAALLLRSLNLPAARTLALVVLGCFLMVRVLDKRWRVEDWRGAVSEAQSLGGVPLLVNTGLVEGRSVEWLRDPARREYLLAPLVRYGKLEGAWPLPFSQAVLGGEDYLKSINLAKSASPIAVSALCLPVKGADCSENYFKGLGLRLVESKKFGLVERRRWGAALSDGASGPVGAAE